MTLLLSVISTLLVVSVFISRIHNDYWVFKILEYPRLQKLAVILIVLASWFIYWPFDQSWHWIFFGALLLSVIYLLYKIAPYTPLIHKEMHKVVAAEKEDEIKIFTANVYQYNTAYARMLQQIQQTDPDVIFLLETDIRWVEGVNELKSTYPYTLLQPLDNTYGLLFFSRFKISEAKINYLVKKDVPSIEGLVHLPSGRVIKIWGLHPQPPVPGENLYSTAKDKELMQVAFKVKECAQPVIIFGDLNDVAWSHTTELFRKITELLDPRRGRGFFSTFSAKSWLIRFPLDYIFCSRHFGLVKMKRMPKNGSDHFAVFIHLVYVGHRPGEDKAPKAIGHELKEAKKIAAQRTND